MAVPDHDRPHAWQPGLKPTTGLVSDPPAVVVRRHSHDAYEIVVGHRGLGGFAGLLLGSVGPHTAGYATGAAVVVRGESHARAVGGPLA